MDRDLDLWFKPAKTGRPHLGITRLQEDVDSMDASVPRLGGLFGSRPGRLGEQFPGEEAGGGERLRDKPGAERAQQGRVAAQTGSWCFSSHQRVVLLHDIIGGHGRAEDLRTSEALLGKLRTRVAEEHAFDPVRAVAALSPSSILCPTGLRVLGSGFIGTAFLEEETGEVAKVMLDDFAQKGVRPLPDICLREPGRFTVNASPKVDCSS
ncbi:unnamed protein product [Symbiodinium sp. CCMP2456]|nr:unnamed protein product [Symbiodinium sp. CCMP2456]